MTRTPTTRLSPAAGCIRAISLRKEADGSLTFVDRKRYLIKTGGENVYPAEVEAVLARHPSVQEVCVFGVPDPHWGETIKAVIVPRAGATAGRLARSSRSAANILPATSGRASSNSSPPNACRAAPPASCNVTNSPNGRSARIRRSSFRQKRPSGGKHGPQDRTQSHSARECRRHADPQRGARAERSGDRRWRAPLHLSPSSTLSPTAPRMRSPGSVSREATLWR